MMIYLAYALCYATGVAGAVYLAFLGYPWLSFVMLLGVGSVKFKVRGLKGRERTPEN